MKDAKYDMAIQQQKAPYKDTALMNILQRDGVHCGNFAMKAGPLGKSCYRQSLYMYFYICIHLQQTAALVSEQTDKKQN
jgi:hypothetical protein